jgi:hypothetical protein
MTSFPSLAEWFSRHGQAQAQRTFFEDRLSPAVARADPTATVSVVSWHESSGRLALPVVRVESLKFGLRVWMRDSFFDWAVTVESERPARMKVDPSQILTNGLRYCYFEGFKRGGLPVHGPHERNPTRFSFHCFGNECLMDIIGGLIAA